MFYGLGFFFVVAALGVAGYGVWDQNSSAQVILVICGALLLIGVALLGVAEVKKTPGTSARWFWYLGTHVLPTGVRVLFLIPLSAAAWLGVMAAVHVVWENLPSSFSRAQVPTAWSIVGLIIGTWIAWRLLWPSEPDEPVGTSV